MIISKETFQEMNRKEKSHNLQPKGTHHWHFDIFFSGINIRKYTLSKDGIIMHYSVISSYQ